MTDFTHRSSKLWTLAWLRFSKASSLYNPQSELQASTALALDGESWNGKILMMQ